MTVRLLGLSRQFWHIWGRGIGDLDDAFLQNGARSWTTLGIEGYRVKRFSRFDLELMTRGRRGSVNQLMAFKTAYVYEALIKQLSRALHDCIEHRLHFSGRTADDIEHVAGGRLILERFLQLGCTRLHL